MRGRTKLSAKKSIKHISVLFCVFILVISLTGCSIGNFNLSFLDKFKNGAVDEQDLYSLDTALLSAAVLNFDDGSFNAVYKDNGEFSLGNKSGSVTFNLSNGDVKSTDALSGEERPFVFSSGFFAYDGEVSVLFDAYKEHLTAAFGSYEQAINSDINSDGINDLVFVVKGICSGDEATKLFGNGITEQFSCLYVSLSEGNAYYQASSIAAPAGTVSSADFKNGFLMLKDSNNSIISTEIYDKYGDKSKLENQLKGYTKSIQDAGAKDVRVRLLSLSGGNGTDAVICYQLNDGYIVEFCSVVNDKFSIVLRHDTTIDPCAFLLINNGDRYSVFTYNQKISEENLVDYNYSVFSFDRKFEIDQIDTQSITVNTTENVSLKTNQFFKTVSELLSEATVCYDPYKLTGYSLMHNSNDLGLGIDEEAYVVINNCSTSKSGYVLIDDADTWLNLREGPSKDFDRVLINPKDKKSYVKQSLFSPVTIIEPVNTFDSKNPIWLKIEINYMDKTLVGYSSQRYIEIPGIKTLRCGESFTVDATSNSGDVSWYSSDYSVIDINEFTGELTAYSPGIVLITAISSSGAIDSCLIMAK